MLTEEIVKQTCVRTVEQYLHENKIEFERAESESGSIYYTLILFNGTPKIRISDHKFRQEEDYKLCSLSINYAQDFGKHSTIKKVSTRVRSMLNKLIRNHSIYHIHRMFEQLKDETK